jgi:hypothetical protein
MDFMSCCARARGWKWSCFGRAELIKGQVLARQEALFDDIEIVPGVDWKPDQETELELEFDE